MIIEKKITLNQHISINGISRCKRDDDDWNEGGILSEEYLNALRQ